MMSSWLLMFLLSGIICLELPWWPWRKRSSHHEKESREGMEEKNTHPWLPYILIRCWEKKLDDSYNNRIVKAHHPLKDRRMLKLFCKIPKIKNLTRKSNFTRMVTWSFLNTFPRNNVCCNVLIKINKNPSWTSFLNKILGSLNQSSTRVRYRLRGGFYCKHSREHRTHFLRAIMNLKNNVDILLQT